VARLDGRTANVNQHVCVVRVRSAAFDPTFLASALASRAGQAQIFTAENGISRDALNFEQIGIDPKTQIVQGRTVCVVSCQRSPEPVFLR
jgi:hypothetical protein